MLKIKDSLCDFSLVKSAKLLFCAQINGYKLLTI